MGGVPGAALRGYRHCRVLSQLASHTVPTITQEVGVNGSLTGDKTRGPEMDRASAMLHSKGDRAGLESLSLTGSCRGWSQWGHKEQAAQVGLL